jgi:hypothetical protein
MAITTVDQAIAGMTQPAEIAKAVTGTLVAGRAHSLWYLAGIPAAGAAASVGLVGEQVLGGGAIRRTGQMDFTNPTSGSTYLARFQGQALIAGTLMLCDRLWHNNGYDVTSSASQTFTGSCPIPARDNYASASGFGVYAAVEISSATAAGTPTLTLYYTDQDGNTGASSNNIFATAASPIQGTFFIMGLAQGDVGIRRADGLKLSATWTSGSIQTVLFRILSRLELTAGNVPNAVDVLTGGRVPIPDNACPFLVFIPSTTTTGNITGHAIWTQG